MRNLDFRYYEHDNLLINLEQVTAIHRQGNKILFYLPHGAITVSHSLMTEEGAKREMQKLLAIFKPQKPKTIGKT